ncbi:MAG: transglutaminase-like domain-containing protein [Flavobacteriales bacterium]
MTASRIRNLQEALEADVPFDAQHPLLMRHLEAAVLQTSGWERLERWYLRVRDGITYNPWKIAFDVEAIRASKTLEDQEGHCIAKSVLFVSGCRALGIPAMIGFARVRNHLATEKLEAKLGTNVLTPHGYAAFWNGKKWVKCTPVFNASLCKHYGVDPLPFSRDEDQLFQERNGQGEAFMAYEEDYGLYARFPMDQTRTWFTTAYPHMDLEVDFNEE